MIHNEQTKLLANALDRASTACFAAGVIGPAYQALATGQSMDWKVTLGLTYVAFFVGVMLHAAARRVLKGLR